MSYEEEYKQAEQQAKHRVRLRYQAAQITQANLSGNFQDIAVNAGEAGVLHIQWIKGEGWKSTWYDSAQEAKEKGVICQK